MNRPTPLSLLQKSYDDAHLVCSTAIYFESRSNESEALRCWRNALDQLTYHKLYRIPGAWRATNDTEKELVNALLGLERQARERIGLLEALESSRKDAGVAADAGIGLGGGTVKPLAMNDLPGPPPLPNRPMPPREPSAQSVQSMSRSSKIRGQSRSPSPEKKPKMKSTLRTSGKPSKSSSNISKTRRSEPQGASKAATLAWTTKNGSPVLVEPQSMAHANFEVHPRLRAARVRSISPPPSRESTRAVVNEPRAHETVHDDEFDMTARTQAAHRPTVRNGRNGRQSVPPYRQSSHQYQGPPGQASLQPAHGHDRLGSNPRIMNLQSHNHPQGSQEQLAPRPPSTIHRRPIRTPVKTAVPTPLPPAELEQTLNDLELDRSSSLSDSDDDASEEEEESWVETSARILQNLPRGVDPHAAEQILNEVIIQGDEVHWDDIAGLEIAKAALKENVVYPFLRPDLFRGLREPARGILLFGPPGTGKTMLARAVATESKSTFFAVSASSLISKFLGESEKLVRALFSLAKLMAPSVIFVDEIDSLLSSRSDQGEHETSRRIKTEFLIQWSDLARAAAGRDAKAGDAGRVLVLAATNAPWAIDDAARRRFVRRQYIPLPEGPVRAMQIRTLLAEQKHNLGDRDVKQLIERTQDFSGSDITALAKDAAMGPLRSLGDRLLLTKPDEIRPISFVDFEASLQTIRPSVNKAGLQQFDDWAKEYGERGG